MNEALAHVRVTNAVFPQTFVIPLSETMTITQMHVPVDDTHNHWYAFFTSFDGPVDKNTMRQQRLEAVTLPDYIPKSGRHNNWGFNAAEQQSSTYLGMGEDDINVHDQWACESMGAIQDRTREHLGTTDKVIMANRRLLQTAIATVADGGVAPGIADPAQHSAIRGPDTVDGIAPADGWEAWWHNAVTTKRAGAPWDHAVADASAGASRRHARTMSATHPASFAARCGVQDAAREAACLRAAAAIEASKVDAVRLSWCDLHGQLRGKTLEAPRRHPRPARRRGHGRHPDAQGHRRQNGLEGVRSGRRRRHARLRRRRQPHAAARSRKLHRPALGPRPPAGCAANPGSWTAHRSHSTAGVCCKTPWPAWRLPATASRPGWRWSSTSTASPTPRRNSTPSAPPGRVSRQLSK